MRLCVAANLKRKSLWWWCCRLVLSAWQGLIANFGPQKSLSNVCHIYSTPFIKMPNVWMTSPPLTILMIMTWKPTPPWKPVNPGLQGQEKVPMLYNNEICRGSVDGVVFWNSCEGGHEQGNGKVWQTTWKHYWQIKLAGDLKIVLWPIGASGVLATICKRGIYEPWVLNWKRIAVRTHLKKFTVHSSMSTHCPSSFPLCMIHSKPAWHSQFLWFKISRCSNQKWRWEATSHPHSPSAQGLWSAQRLLQHLQPVESYFYPISWNWNWKVTFIQSPATCGKLLLSNQLPVTCVALTLGVVWKPLNLKPRPKSGIQSTLVMWTWKVVRKSGHLLVHSTSQSIPPLLPASFPGAWHWLWSLLAHGPSNGKLRSDSCQRLVSFPNWLVMLGNLTSTTSWSCGWGQVAQPPQVELGEPDRPTSPWPQGLSYEQRGLLISYHTFSSSQFFYFLKMI